MCDNCEEIFCNDCIDQYLESDKDCPKCKENFEKRVKGKLYIKLKNDLSALQFVFEKTGEKYTYADAYKRAQDFSNILQVSCSFCKTSEFFEDFKEYGFHLVVECPKMHYSCT